MSISSTTQKVVELEKVNYEDHKDIVQFVTEINKDGSVVRRFIRKLEQWDDKCDGSYDGHVTFREMYNVTKEYGNNIYKRYIRNGYTKKVNGGN